MVFPCPMGTVRRHKRQNEEKARDLVFAQLDGHTFDFACPANGSF